jgi:hypothetical protein
MSEPEKITIVEGPPPTFELVVDSWLLGLTEGPLPKRVAMCRLRTFNGPALVERCHRAWHNNQTIALEYRTEEGLTQQAPIVGARWLEQPEGHLLLLWVRLEEEEIEIEIDFQVDDFGFDDREIDFDIDDFGFDDCDIDFDIDDFDNIDDGFDEKIDDSDTDLAI